MCNFYFLLFKDWILCYELTLVSCNLFFCLVKNKFEIFSYNECGAWRVVGRVKLERARDVTSGANNLFPRPPSCDEMV